MLKLTEQQAGEIAFDDSEEFKKIEEGKWIDGGKYSYSNIIFSPIDKKIFYRLEVIRSGSYFSDYHYDYNLNCPKVEQIREFVEIKKWVLK